MATEHSPESLRGELIRQVELGNITPAEADSEAKFADCWPLEARPESIDLDPQTESQWSLLMALVWIIERDLAAVRAVWVKARRAAKCWVRLRVTNWDETGAEGRKIWELAALNPPTIGDLESVVAQEARFMLPPFIVAGATARKDLMTNLYSGRLPAFGARFGTSEQAIPATEWSDLDWIDDLAAPADMVRGRNDKALNYERVTVPGQVVREIWAPLESLRSEEFEREDWSIAHALLWIAYRNPVVFHFVRSLGWRARVRFSSLEMRDPSASDALLEALMTGKLRAIRNGREIEPEHWFGKSLPRWRGQASLDGASFALRREPGPEEAYYVRRSSLLGHFKEGPLIIAKANIESKAKKRLRETLSDSPNLKRDEAEGLLARAGLAVTGRAFNRVWKGARVEAGLPETKKGGRPPKS
jgi:hypothetical protein